MTVDTWSADTREKLFESLLEARDRVFRICLGFCRSYGDAEDLTHDVYVTAYMKLKTLKNSEARLCWLYKITRNTCLNHIQRSPRWQTLPLSESIPCAEEGTPEENLELQEQMAVLKTVVASLPRKMREVFIMREYGLLSYEEIAGALGLRLGTVMSRLNRARRFVVRKMRSEIHE